jgi:hypothetical protein
METADWICSTWEDTHATGEWMSIIDILYGAIQATSLLGTVEAYEASDDYELLLNIAQSHFLTE